MPTYQYEAMDTTGGEVKDTIDATSEEEAQQKIRSLGYFVTRLTEVAGKKKKDKKKAAQGDKRKKTKVLTLGGVNGKQLVVFTRQFSVLQDAGLPVLRSLKIRSEERRVGKEC